MHACRSSCNVRQLTGCASRRPSVSTCDALSAHILCATCSIALQSTSIWTNAIGLEAHVNTNEEIERQINAPTFGGGGGRAARRAAAAEVVEATGADWRTVQDA